ncbi:MAG: pyridoxal 5'-phosphate synthase glutaminase subunit PdxT [Candidatus Anstonellaceae archaeon]
MKIGILALQGDFFEHAQALEQAAKKLKIKIEIIFVRNENDLDALDGLIIPGGESTTLSTLIEEFGLEKKIKKIRNFLVTCAGLIILAKDVEGLEKNQSTLSLMDIKIKRNAYGSQIDSFYAELKGDILENKKVAFIRAPKIERIGKNVKVLARIKKNNEIAIIEQKTEKYFMIGATCHPELDWDELELYFLKKIS